MRSPTRRRSGSGTHSRDHAQASSQGGSRRPLPSQAQCITVQEGNFHGPSSALFDDETIRNNASRDPPDAVDANKKNQLLAEATRQRKWPLALLVHCLTRS
jgi:hypothetical protein